MNEQDDRGVIEVGQSAKIRRLQLRDGMPIKKISRTLELSRNTVKRWLRAGDIKVPAYPKRSSPSKLDAYKEVLAGWLKLNAHRNKCERKSVTTMTEAVRGSGLRWQLFASCSVCPPLDGGVGRSLPAHRIHTAEISAGDAAKVLDNDVLSTYVSRVLLNRASAGCTVVLQLAII